MVYQHLGLTVFLREMGISIEPVCVLLPLGLVLVVAVGLVYNWSVRRAVSIDG